MTTHAQPPPATSTSSPSQINNITIIGIGTIGLSLCALYISAGLPTYTLALTILDPRPDLHAYVSRILPTFLDPKLHCLIPSIKLHTDYAADLPAAVRSADAIHEAGPENANWKGRLWADVAPHVAPHTLLWSATSGIPASAQIAAARAHLLAPRLLVVHPYNPPHILPLLELVPSPLTSLAALSTSQAFFSAQLKRSPVVLRKETRGFATNRLAFALLREACALVNEGVCSVEDVDTVVQGSMGPRWAVGGMFRSYAAGGGEGGLRAFWEKVGGTVGEVWEESAKGYGGEEWEETVTKQVQRAYGVPVSVEGRDEATRRVLEV
ncbi:hypothetical protein BDY21DRAFT_270880, partial [Lineolata rhizophorae]